MNENELSKGTKVKVSIITVLVILTTIAGISYAFFSIGVTGNEEASSVTVTAALLRLTYSDNLVISGNGIYPGWSQSKTISVENTGTDTVYYKIIWRELLNEITNDELTISATCVANSGTCPAIEEQAINTYLSQTSNVDIKNGIEIASGVTHTYTITVTFKEMSSAQNYNQGKSFYGTLNIAEGQAQTALFETVGTDSTTGFPVVRSTSVPSEEFYIISDTSNNGINYSSLDSSFLNKINYNSSESILLAKYNLNVGYEGSGSGGGNQQPISSKPLYKTKAQLLALLQNETILQSGSNWGTVPFSGSSNSRGYWDPSASGIKSKYGTYTNYANNIYDTTYVTAPNYNAAFKNDAANANYSVAYYVENYVSSLGVEATGRLLTYPEANAMTTVQRTNGQYYWLGSAYSDSYVRYVWSDGDLSSVTFYHTSLNGVRPVVVVSTSDIQ